MRYIGLDVHEDNITATFLRTVNQYTVKVVQGDSGAVSSASLTAVGAATYQKKR